MASSSASVAMEPGAADAVGPGDEVTDTEAGCPVALAPASGVTATSGVGDGAGATDD